MTRLRWAAFLLIGAVGCGPTVATVEGMVTIDGQPLADAEVQFIPDPTQGTKGPPASAYTGRDGRYRIEASGGNGVLVGKHRVCINDAAIMMPGAGTEVDATDGGPRAGKSSPRKVRVPTVYSDATRTPFNPIEVKAGEQSVDFPLKQNP